MSLEEKFLFGMIWPLSVLSNISTFKQQLKNIFSLNAFELPMLGHFLGKCIVPIFLWQPGSLNASTMMANICTSIWVAKNPYTGSGWTARTVKSCFRFLDIPLISCMRVNSPTVWD